RIKTASMEAVITSAAAYGLKGRLELSKAKYRSPAGHARIARLVTSLVPFYQYDEAKVFKADSATDAVCLAAGRRSAIRFGGDPRRRNQRGLLGLYRRGGGYGIELSRAGRDDRPARAILRALQRPRQPLFPHAQGR